MQLIKKLEKEGNELPKEDIAASFQEAVTDVLCEHTIEGALLSGAKTVALAGDETVYDVSGLTAIGTGNYALRYDDGTTTKIYSGEGQTLTLTCTGSVPTGYGVVYTVTKTFCIGLSEKPAMKKLKKSLLIPVLL